jgi:thiamine transport system permease protein
VTRWQVLGLKRFVPLALAPSAVLLLGWLIGVISSLHHYVSEGLFFDPMIAALNTLIVALGVGFLILWFCLWISYVWPNRKLAWFMKSYLTPSNAITGFALLLLPGQSGEWPLLKMIVALTLVSFPLLFRWLGQSALESLEEEIVVARTLGASWSQILFEIIWPQRGPVFFRMAALGSLWASGDFALSGIMAEGHNTWALWIDSLLNSYRLDLASLLTIPLFALGLFCYAFFVGASRYVNR